MVDALGALVGVESPSDDAAALRACASAVADLFADRLGSRPSGGPHLVWSGGGECRVVLIGHYDTVWPVGTLAERPFGVDGGMATGPGCFDMKAGIVQLVEALAVLDDPAGVTVLLTADEEIGSLTSRSLIEDTSRGATAALVLEPSVDGMLKTARKGTGTYTLRVHGRASHAGLEPEKGANALLGLASILPAVADLGRPEVGTTVTPTVASAGTATNVVPALATVEVDVRISVPDEADRVDKEIRSLLTSVPDTTVSVEGGLNRPPMPSSASVELLARAQRCAARLGLAPLGGASVGGGSDGNFTAAVGTPTLDGLGAVGAGAHAVDERVVVAAMPERAALLAELIEELLDQ
jgi:glutamate carboxypeptidase